MKKKTIIMLLTTLFLVGYGICLADKGLADMVLQAEKASPITAKASILANPNRTGLQNRQDFPTPAANLWRPTSFRPGAANQDLRKVGAKVN